MVPLVGLDLSGEGDLGDDALCGAADASDKVRGCCLDQELFEGELLGLSTLLRK